MEPIIISHLFESTIDKVWKALTEEEALKTWYFPIENYKLEVGNKFSFYESCDSRTYLHACEILSIVPYQSISYTWAHPSHSKGSSIVTWTIKEENEKIRVTLQHEGVENFMDGGDSFKRENYVVGWDAIVKSILRNYLYDIKQLKFNVVVSAPESVVWNCLWEKESYKKWTNSFCEGTYYEGEMEQGNRIHFLTPSGEGMYSDIFMLKPNELVMFKHIGYLKQFSEQAIDNETEKWTGCYENYKLSKHPDGCQLVVEVDTIGQYIDWMNKAFPLALSALKEIAEYQLQGSDKSQ